MSSRVSGPFVPRDSMLLNCPGADLPGVHHLRAIEDVPQIVAALKPGAFT
jgi:hypothetical protein